MDIIQAMEQRHSVRSYLDKEIENEKVEVLQELIDEINQRTKLHIQLVLNEPDGFSGKMASYGSFSGVKNYIVLAGPKHMDREIGYYGEKIVLKAQMLGLNTCWVALTFNKKKTVFSLEKGEKLYMVISLGYAAKQGRAHKSREKSAVCNLSDDTPEWFKNAMKAVLLAPTAINQQKFYFKYKDGVVTSKAGLGPYSVTDLGIAQYHFDVATDKNNFGLER